MGEPTRMGEVPFSNGTEYEEWLEVWCYRCGHDHEQHVDESGGCGIAFGILAYPDDPPVEIQRGGYRIVVANGQDKVIPNERGQLPAAITCSEWTPCEPGCMQHSNGAIITDVQINIDGGR